MDRLEKLLKDLSRSVSLDNSLFDAVQTASAIQQYCEQVEPRSKQFTVANALLFSSSSPPSLLHFITTTTETAYVGDKSLIEARILIYEILRAWITRHGNWAASDHIDRIRKASIRVFQSETASKPKSCCLDPLRALLELQSLMLDDDLFEAPHLAQVVLKDYLYGKCSATVRGMDLEFLGLLSERFPETFADPEQSLFQDAMGPKLQALCLEALVSNLQKSKPEIPIIAGALAALSHLLVEFPLDVEEDPKTTAKLYQAVRLGIEIPPGLKRFDVAKQSLLLLARHANLFIEQIMKEPDAIFALVRQCVSSPHTKVRRNSIGAVMSVMRVISQGTIDLPDPQARKVVLGHFMKTFNQSVDCSSESPNQSTVYDIEIAVRGFGYFAAAVKEIAGVEQLRFVLRKLFDINDRLDRREEQEILKSMQISQSGGSTSLLRMSEDPRSISMRSQRMLRHANFLQTFALVIYQLSSVGSESQDSIVLDKITREVVALGTEYPLAYTKGKIAMQIAVRNVFASLVSKKGALSEVLSRCILPLLVRSTSVIDFESDDIESSIAIFDPDTGLPDTRLFFEYISFWRGLLPGRNWPSEKFLKMTKSNAVTESHEQTELIVDEGTGDIKLQYNEAKESCFNYFMVAVTKLLQRLDLSYTKVSTRAEELTDTADSTGQGQLVPVVLGDFQIFMNLTELCCRLLAPRYCHYSHLIPWLPVYFRVLVDLVESYPLVSGLYKLIELGLDALQLLDVAVKRLGNCVDTFADDRDRCYSLLRSFITATMLRSKQFQDELLCSALSCLLSVPSPMLGDYLEDNGLFTIMTAAFSVGLSYTPLATKALNSLQRWVKLYPETSTSILTTVLPLVNQYLTSDTVRITLTENAPASNPDDVLDPIKPKSSRANPNERSKIRTGKNRFSGSDDQESLRESQTLIEVFGEDERNNYARRGDFAHLQQRLVTFLGQIGGLNRFIVPPLKDRLRNAVAWDSSGSKIGLELPMGNVFLKVHLDSIVPRVVYLARYAGARQIKVAACEFLHGLLLFMIGDNAAQQPASSLTAGQDGAGTFSRGSSSRSRRSGGASQASTANASDSPYESKYTKLYEHIIPELFYLAVDVEKVTRQLFGPLLLQICRWFAHNGAREHEDVVCLLDAAIECVGNHTDSALREVSAECLAIFFKWSIKTRTKVQVRQNPVNVKSILRRLFFLFRHPDPYKRLGGAKVFAAIYRDLREETDLIDEFALDLLYHAVHSLRLAHYDSNALGTLEAASGVLDNLCRIIARKAAVLRCPRVPSRTSGASSKRKAGAPDPARQSLGPRSGIHGDLHSTIRWLFRQCSRRELQLRTKCMQLFEIFANTCYQEKGGVSYWMQALLEGKKPAVEPATASSSTQVIGDTLELDPVLPNTSDDSMMEVEVEETKESVTLLGIEAVVSIVESDNMITASRYVKPILDVIVPSQIARSEETSAASGENSVAHVNLAMLTAMLDMYTWLMRRKLVETSEFQWNLLSSGVAKTQLLTILRTICDDVNFAVQASSTTSQVEGNLMSPAQQQARIGITMSMTNFLSALMSFVQQLSTSLENEEVFTVLNRSMLLEPAGSPLFELLFRSCLCPISLGIDPDSRSAKQYLPASLERLVTGLLDRASATGVSYVKESLSRSLARYFGLLNSAHVFLSMEESESTSAIINICQQQAKKGNGAGNVLIQNTTALRCEVRGLGALQRAGVRIGEVLTLQTITLGAQSSLVLDNLDQALAMNLMKLVWSLPSNTPPETLTAAIALLSLCIALGWPMLHSDAAKLDKSSLSPGTLTVMEVLFCDEVISSTASGNLPTGSTQTEMNNQVSQLEDGAKVGVVFLQRFSDDILDLLLRKDNCAKAIHFLCDKISKSRKSISSSSEANYDRYQFEGSQAFSVLSSVCERRGKLLDGLRSQQQMISREEFLKLVLPALEGVVPNPDEDAGMDLETIHRNRALERRLGTLMIRLIKVDPSEFGPHQDEEGAQVVRKVFQWMFRPKAPVVSKVDAIGAVQFLLSGGCTTSHVRYQRKPNEKLKDVLTSSSSMDSTLIGYLATSVVAEHFPLNSRSQLMADESDNYVALLNAVLVALEISGSIHLLRLLYREIRQGDEHIHASFINKSLSVLVSNCDTNVVDSSGFCGATVLAMECIRVMFSTKQDDKRVKKILFTKVAVPLFLSLKPSTWNLLLTSTGILETDKSGSEDDCVLGRILDCIKSSVAQEDTKGCAFQILEAMYQSLDTDTIKSITRTFLKDPKSPGNEIAKIVAKFGRVLLNKAATQALHGATEPIEDTNTEHYLAQDTLEIACATGDDLIKALSEQERLCNTVYRCLVALVCRTQSQVKFFDSILFSNAGTNDIMHVLIPSRRENTSEPKFTVQTQFQKAEIAMETLAYIEGWGPGNSEARKPRTSAFDMLSAASQSQMLLPSLEIPPGLNSFAVKEDGGVNDEADDRNDTSNANDSWVEQQQKQNTIAINVDESNKEVEMQQEKLPAAPISDDDDSDMDSPSEKRERLLQSECDTDQESDIEMDPLNCLPLMTALLTAIDTMRAKDLLGFPAGIATAIESQSDEMRPWARTTLSALTDRRCHGGDTRQTLNIRLFACKLIMNRPTLFAPFARRLVIPCIQVALDLEAPFAGVTSDSQVRSVSSNDSGRGFHYFLRDLCVLIGRWERLCPGCCSPPPSDANAWAAISQFVDMLLPLCPNASTPIMKINLQMVALVISFWSKTKSGTQPNPLLVINQQIVSQMFAAGQISGQRAKSQDVMRWASTRAAGLNLIGCIVEAGYNPLSADLKIRLGGADQFYRQLAENLLFPRKRITVYAAEVIAMMLRTLGARNDPVLREEAEILRAHVERILTDLFGRKKHGEWLVIVASFAKSASYPVPNEGTTTTNSGATPVVLTPKVVSNVVSIAHVLQGDHRRLALSIVLHACQEHSIPIEDIHLVLRGSLPRWLSWENNDAKAVIIVLRLVQRAVFHLGEGSEQSVKVKAEAKLSTSDVETNYLGNIIELALEYKVEEARAAAVELLIWLHDNFFVSGQPGHRAIRMALLTVLNDKAAPIRKLAIDFWENARRLPCQSVFQRVMQVLMDLSPSSLDPEAAALLGGGPTRRGASASPKVAKQEKLLMLQKLWPRHAGQLVLAMVRKTPEYHNRKRKLFSHALSECTFNDVEVDSSWEGTWSGTMAGTQPLLPMFSTIASQSESQATQSASRSASRMSLSSQFDTQSFLKPVVTQWSDVSQVAGGMVRATLGVSDLAFDPTQQPGGPVGTNNNAVGGGNMGTQSLGVQSPRTNVVVRDAKRARIARTKYKDSIWKAARNVQSHASDPTSSMLFHLATKSKTTQSLLQDPDLIDRELMPPPEAPSSVRRNQLGLQSSQQQQQQSYLFGANTIATGGNDSREDDSTSSDKQSKYIPSYLRPRRFGSVEVYGSQAGEGSGSYQSNTQVSHSGSGAGTMGRLNYFQIRAMREARIRSVQEVKMKQRALKQVVMYRKYREGELPDIEISLKELVEPLMAVAGGDTAVSNGILQAVFEAMCIRLTDTDADREDLVPLLDGGEQVLHELGALKQREQDSNTFSADSFDLTEMKPRNVLGFVQRALERMMSTNPAASLMLQDDVSECSDSDDELENRTKGEYGIHRYDTGFVMCVHALSNIAAEQAAESVTTTELKKHASTIFNAIEDLMVEVKPEVIGGSSVGSSSYSSGALLLEDRIIRAQVLRGKQSDVVRLSGRGSSSVSQVVSSTFDASSSGVDTQSSAYGNQSRLTNQGATSGIWLELYRLYEGLREEDVLLGLITDATSCPETKTALELQVAGDYFKAADMYSNLLRTRNDHATAAGGGHDPPSVQECEHWWRSRLECLKLSGEWETLINEVLHRDRVDEDGNSTPSPEPSPLAAIVPSNEWLPALLWDKNRLGVDMVHYLQAACKTKPEHPRLLRHVHAALAGSRDPVYKAATQAVTANGSPASELLLPPVARRNWLELNTPMELVLCDLSEQPTPRFGSASARVQDCLSRFMDAWAMTSPVAASSQHQLLRPLQGLVDVLSFLRCRQGLSLTGWSYREAERRVNSLLDEWHNSVPSLQLDPVDTWETVVFSRQLCFQLLAKDLDTAVAKFQRASDTSAAGKLKTVVDTLSTKMQQQSVRLWLLASMAARSQGALGVSGRFLDQIAAGGTMSLGLLEAKVGLEAMHATRAIDLAAALKHLRTAEGLIQQSSGLLNSSSNQTEDEYNAKLMRYSRVQGFIALDLAHKESIHGKLSSGDLTELAQGGIRNLETSMALEGTTVLAGHHQEQFFVSDDLGKASGMVKLAEFCDQLLQSQQSNQQLPNTAKPITLSSPEYSTPAALAERVIENLIAAAQLGSLAAVDLFPRTLALLGDLTGSAGKRVAKAFKSAVKDIPMWVHLRWIPQMLSLIDKTYAEPVVDYLIEIARVYPRAISSPLRVTVESFEELKVNLSEVPHYSKIQTLQRLVQDPMLNRFEVALAGLNNPELRLKDVLGDMNKILSNAVKFRHDTEKTLKRVRDMWCDQVLNGIVSESNVLVQDKIGDYNRQFAKANRSKLLKQFGKDGSKLLKGSVRDVYRSVHALRSLVNSNMAPQLQRRMQLSKFSEWLAEYDPTDFSTALTSDVDDGEHVGNRVLGLEVPGQYDCWQNPLHLGPPNLSTRVHVAGFGPELLVMESLRKPKRLTIRGSDEQETRFLVKGGEDLRLDQRIEQLFGMMNRLYQTDGACAQRGLRVHTYRVVPLSLNTGLIEWVDGTKPLKAVIEDQYRSHPRYTTIERDSGKRSKSKSKGDLGSWTASAKYASWFKANSGGKEAGDLHGYAQLYKRVKASKSRQDYEEILSCIPIDLLRRHIAKSAVGAEAFLALREQFGRSLAVLNVSSYILGIGDRHLDNFLLNEKDGTVIPIDFGYAFGVGTMNLPLAETAPFRLTPQLAQVLEPLSTRGLLQQSMVRAMRALHHGQDKLLHTMNVFVNEPLVEWLQNADLEQSQDLASISGDSTQESAKSDVDLTRGDVEWLPRLRVRIAELKLKGAHPVAVMTTELKERLDILPKNPVAPGDIVTCLQQSVKDPNMLQRKPLHAFRENWDPYILDQTKQVEALVDLATEPAVLLRMWVGWRPWV